MVCILYEVATVLVCRVLLTYSVKETSPIRDVETKPVKTYLGIMRYRSSEPKSQLGISVKQEPSRVIAELAVVADLTN